MDQDDTTDDKLDMASQEEAVVAQEEVKNVGEFPVNGAPNSSFNSRISSVPREFDMAESQVAVAGSVDLAAEIPLSAGAKPDAVDTGPAVDATEKVESWDLSEAVREGATNKEDSKPNFSEDGPFEDTNTQASDSDLNASAEHVVEKAVEAEGAVTEELPAATEDVNPKVQDEGSAQPEVNEEVAQPDDEVASPEPESVERKNGSIDERSLVVEDKPVEVEAAIEEGSSSSDATPLEVSSPPPPVDEKEKAPKSYDLHEVVVELEDAAEKTLEEVKSSIVSGRQASFAESVAQIVLEEREKTEDSSELLSGVIQHVAQLAQDDFRADPNVLPDTMNQVFDREIASSPSNEASIQPKETTSLGTKFSLFIVWCISLCASHVSSKDMSAPALKLGAEEVAAVLQQNAQGAASSKVA